MKRIILLILAAVCLHGHAQQDNGLRFNESGEFKIVQFTDLHFKYGNPASDVALECIDRVLEAESPDLVIFTGDIIYSAPADTALRTVLQRVCCRKIPFAVTLGNHDDEQGLSRPLLYEIVRSLPGNVQAADSENFALRIASADGQRTEALLYLIDSHAYSPLPDVKGYDWIKARQISCAATNIPAKTEESRYRHWPFSTFPCLSTPKRPPIRKPSCGALAWSRSAHPS